MTPEAGRVWQDMWTAPIEEEEEVRDRKLVAGEEGNGELGVGADCCGESKRERYGERGRGSVLARGYGCCW